MWPIIEMSLDYKGDQYGDDFSSRGEIPTLSLFFSHAERLADRRLFYISPPPGFIAFPFPSVPFPQIKAGKHSNKSQKLLTTASSSGPSKIFSGV